MSTLREKAIEIAKQTSSESAFVCGYDRACQEYEEKLRWIPVEEKQPKIEKIPKQVLCKIPDKKLNGFRLRKDVFEVVWVGKYETDFIDYCKRRGITEWRSFL